MVCDLKAILTEYLPPRLVIFSGVKEMRAILSNKANHACFALLKVISQI